MYIWGTGNIGHLAYEALIKNKISVDGFIDSFYMCESIVIGEDTLKVYGIKELSNLNGDVIVAVSQYESIVSVLVELSNLNFLGVFVPNIGIVDYSELFRVKNNSQDGEELYLREIFSNKKEGFYVDVGALHPYRFSNTFWAYERGWKGINIEPNPDMYKLFCRYRDKDINLNLGVGNEEGYFEYYMYVEPAYNSFWPADKKTAKEVRKIYTKTLKRIFNENNVEEIDFISIDVEGAEMEVLLSNDWKKWCPKWILIEQLDLDLENQSVNPVCVFLRKQGYVLDSKYHRTAFWRRRDEKE